MIGAVMVTAKLATVGLGAALLGKMGLAAEDASLLNVALNFVSLAVLVGGIVFLPRALRVKGLQAQIAEKDAIIASRKELADTAKDEATAAKEKNTELGALLDGSRSDAAAWKARYEEQSQYTAAPALEAITRLLEQSERESQRRHTEILLALRALGSNRVVIDNT